MNEISDLKHKPTVLVTGAAGFLGERIVEELLQENSPLEVKEVIGFDIKAYTGNSHPNFRFIEGDIINFDAVNELMNTIDIVIHSAAIIDWGTKSKEDVLAVNLDGTHNIIKACKLNGVEHIVYTSSLDAVYTGKPLRNINENQDYPRKHANVYCESKQLAEEAILAANTNDLRTCILRPCDIFGEKDPYHIEPLIGMAKSGFYVRLGNGSSKCQHVYVGNMAYAHVLAAKELWTKNEKIVGEIYFITDGDGENFFKFYDSIVEGAGYRIFPKNFWIPKSVAYSMGAISEGIAIVMRPIKKYNPNFSRFAVNYTCTDFTFSADKAKDELGYSEKYSHEEAVQNTINHFHKLNKNK